MLLHDYDGKSWQSLMGKEGRNERTGRPDVGIDSDSHPLSVKRRGNFRAESDSDASTTTAAAARQRHLVDIVAPIAIAKAVVIPERSFSHEFHQ